MHAPLALSAATFLLCVSGAQTPQADVATELAYRAEAGRVTPWRTKLTSNVEVAAAETGEVESVLEIGGEFDVDLLGQAAGADGEVRQRMHLRRMKASVSLGADPAEIVELSRDRIVNGDEVLLASEHPELDALLAAGFEEPTATFVLSKRGITAAIEVDTREPVNPEMGELEFGDEHSLLWPSLPEGPVKVGAKWPGRRGIHSEYEFEKPVEVELVHELVAVHGDLATLHVTGRVEVEGPLSADSDEGRVVVSKLAFEIESKVLFRLGEGAIESAEAEFTFDAHISGLAGDPATRSVDSENRIALARRPSTPAAQVEAGTGGG